MKRTLAHLSDLHIGYGNYDKVCRKMCQKLIDEEIDHIVVTGDITNNGRKTELQIFEKVFAPLIERHRLTIVPGNHDRLGDDVGDKLASGQRVKVQEKPGLYLVCADSTSSHNKSLISGHGVLHDNDVESIVSALDKAPKGSLRCLLLHHHLLPLPAEGFWENVSAWLNLPWAAEVSTGHRLLERLYGKCDLVLHGHRHTPGEVQLGPLAVCNAGSSSQMQTFRVFQHKKGVVDSSQWVKLTGHNRE